MAVNLQTIKDIRNYLAGELSELYTERELRSIANIIIPRVFEMGSMLYLEKENEEKDGREQIRTIMRFCRELKTGKPIQYVLGETVFYDCVIKVNPGVLIPRPETEEFVDLIVKENRGFSGSLLDIGTGSGCIAIALAVNFPSSQVTGIDISGQAILTAKKNAENNNATVLFLKADLFKIDHSETKKADIIVSNPPYVRNSEKQLMKKNVLSFEPHKALFVPDNDPLKFYRAILNLARYILNPGGTVYFEINEAMGKPMHGLLESHQFHKIEILKDINGKDRIAKAKKYD
jgi:release factor glutamine methyltransferase